MTGFRRRGQNLDTYSTGVCRALHPVLFSAFQPACALKSTGYICYAFYYDIHYHNISCLSITEGCRKGASDLLFLSYDPKHGGGSQIQFSQQPLANMRVSLAFDKPDPCQQLPIPLRAGFSNVHGEGDVVIFLL